jgi:uncharacterized repeat protein (TIGR03847 family)
MARAGNESAQLWLEKEQLQALAEAIARMMLEIDSTAGGGIGPERQAAPNPKPADFPARPDVDFQVRALSLRYDSQDGSIGVDAFDRDDEDDTPAFRCKASRAQMESLQANSQEVVAAGRPRCPLCGTPLPAAGVPHFCPPSNGHQRLTGDEEE